MLEGGSYGSRPQAQVARLGTGRSENRNNYVWDETVTPEKEWQWGRVKETSVKLLLNMLLSQICPEVSRENKNLLL